MGAQVLAVCRRVRWAEKRLVRPATEREIRAKRNRRRHHCFGRGLRSHAGGNDARRLVKKGQQLGTRQADAERSVRRGQWELRGRMQRKAGQGRQSWTRRKAPERRPRQRRPEIPAWIWRRHRPAAQAKGKTTARARAALRSDRPAAAGRTPQLESSRTAEAERLLRLSDCGRRLCRRKAKAAASCPI